MGAHRLSWVGTPHARPPGPKPTPPNAPRDQNQHPRAYNGYDEEAVYNSYVNLEPGFQSGTEDFVDAD